MRTTVKRMTIKKTKAAWFYGLQVLCPHCDEDFDLFDYEDTWNPSGINYYVGENDTPRTVGVPVFCPHCGQEFECDFEV